MTQEEEMATARIPFQQLISSSQRIITQLILVRQKSDPFKGILSIPGGFLTREKQQKTQ